MEASTVLNTSVVIYLKLNNVYKKGAQWLSGRVLDSRPKGRGFESSTGVTVL